MNEPSTSDNSSSRPNVPKIEIDKRCLSLLKKLKCENSQLKTELVELQTRYNSLLNHESTVQLDANNQSVSAVSKPNNEMEKLVKRNMELQKMLDENKTDQQISFELANCKVLCEKYKEQLERKNHEILLLNINKSKDAGSSKEIKNICQYKCMFKKLKASVNACYNVIEEGESLLKEEVADSQTRSSIQQQTSEEEEVYIPAVPTVCPNQQLQELSEKYQTLQLENEKIQSESRTTQDKLSHENNLIQEKLSAKQHELEHRQKHADKKISQLQEEIESLHTQTLQLKREKDEQEQIFGMQNKAFQDDFNEERNEKLKAYEQLNGLKKKNRFVSDNHPPGLNHQQQHYRQPVQQQLSQPPTQNLPMSLPQNTVQPPPYQTSQPPLFMPSTSRHPNPQYQGQVSCPGNDYQFYPPTSSYPTTTAPFQGMQDQRERGPPPHIGFPSHNSTSPYQNPSAQQQNYRSPPANTTSGQHPPRVPYSSQQQGQCRPNIQHDASDTTSKDEK